MNISPEQHVQHITDGVICIGLTITQSISQVFRGFLSIFKTEKVHPCINISISIFPWILMLFMFPVPKEHFAKSLHKNKLPHEIVCHTSTAAWQSTVTQASICVSGLCDTHFNTILTLFALKKIHKCDWTDDDDDDSRRDVLHCWKIPAKSRCRTVLQTLYSVNPQFVYISR